MGQMKWMAMMSASDLAGVEGGAVSRSSGEETRLSGVPLLVRVTAQRAALGGRAPALGQPASRAGKEAPCMGR